MSKIVQVTSTRNYIPKSKTKTENPTYEQKRWVLNQLKGSASTWQRWYE